MLPQEIIERADKAIQKNDNAELLNVGRELAGLTSQHPYLVEPLIIVSTRLAEEFKGKSPEFDPDTARFGRYVEVLNLFGVAMRDAPPSFKAEAEAAGREFIGGSLKPPHFSFGSDREETPVPTYVREFVEKHSLAALIA